MRSKLRVCSVYFLMSFLALKQATAAEPPRAIKLIKYRRGCLSSLLAIVNPFANTSVVVHEEKLIGDIDAFYRASAAKLDDRLDPKLLRPLFSHWVERTLIRSSFPESSFPGPETIEILAGENSIGRIELAICSESSLPHQSKSLFGAIALIEVTMRIDKQQAGASRLVKDAFAKTKEKFSASYFLFLDVIPGGFSLVGDPEESLYFLKLLKDSLPK